MPTTEFTLKWDQEGQKYVEAGTDRGVLYVYNEDSTNQNSKYSPGVAWSGLTSVSESPSGGDSNKQYADNQIYVNLRGTEEFGGTIEAFMFPDEWMECNGTKQLATGLTAGQQSRKKFGFCFRTLIGSDTKDLGYAGYKLHLIYGATVSPSESSYETINESPEGMTFSWEFDTVPVDTGVAGLKPTSQLIVDSRTTDPAKLAALEAKLYGTGGTGGTDPYLPMPAEVITTLT